MMPAVAVRSRPIIFSGESPRLILADRKTQTRRVVKDVIPWATDWYCDERSGKWMPDGPSPTGKGGAAGHWRSCPYGRPGDQLWVREAWAYAVGSADAERQIVYRATCQDPPGWPLRRGPYSQSCVWRSPLHMPRWASRLTLEITGVRVERLQSISEADVQAEGCTGSPFGPMADRALFPTHWDRLNAKRGYPWDADPWVWVLSFKRLPMD